MVLNSLNQEILKFCCFELIAGKNIVLGGEEGSSVFFLSMLRGEDGTADFGYFFS